MNDDSPQFGTGPGERVIARDLAGVHALLAPWLQSSLTVDDIRSFFGDAYREALQEYDVEGMHYPAQMRVGGNAEMTAKELHSPVGSWSDHVRPVSTLLTEENLRYWMRLVLECSDEQADELGFDESADV
jgi:hypothetical protein